MNEELTGLLTLRLSKLRIQKTKVVNELQSIKREEELVKTLIQDSILFGTEKDSQGDDIRSRDKATGTNIKATGTNIKATGTDSRGDDIHSGDKVTTLTRGLYYERIARVTLVKPKNKITIEYLESKKVTWRKGYNLLKLQK